MTNPFDIGFYSENELREFGFRSVGSNTKIARNCLIAGVENISLGDNVRIDAFCTLIATGTGWIELGSFIHIASYVLLSGGDGIRIADFAGVSHGTKIYSRTDDFTGNYLTGPCVPARYTGITAGTVSLERHVIIGAMSVILPNVTIGEGSSVGALSLVPKNLGPWGMFVGSPARFIRSRSQRLLELETELRNELAGESPPLD